MREVGDGQPACGDDVVTELAIVTDRWEHRFATARLDAQHKRLRALVDVEVFRVLTAPQIALAMRSFEPFEFAAAARVHSPSEDDFPLPRGTLDPELVADFARAMDDAVFADHQIAGIGIDLADLGGLGWVDGLLERGLAEANRVELMMLARIAVIGRNADRHRPTPAPEDTPRYQAAAQRIVEVVARPESQRILLRRWHRARSHPDEDVGQFHAQVILSVWLACGDERGIGLLRAELQQEHSPVSRYGWHEWVFAAHASPWLLERLLDALDEPGEDPGDRIALLALESVAGELTFDPHAGGPYGGHRPLSDQHRHRLRSTLLALADHSDRLVAGNALRMLHVYKWFRVGEGDGARSLRLERDEAETLLANALGRDRRIEREAIDLVADRYPHAAPLLEPLLDHPAHGDHVFLRILDDRDEDQMRKLCDLARDPDDLDPGVIISAFERCASPHAIVALIERFADPRYRVHYRIEEAVLASLPDHLRPPASEHRREQGRAAAWSAWLEQHRGDLPEQY